MKKPIIGITCLVDWKAERQQQNFTYIEAVLKAGGVPLLLPAVGEARVSEAYANLINGLIVAGGPDMDPKYYGQQPWPELGGISPLMDEAESMLIRRVLDLDKPLLGICRGAQVLNVVAGGTLFQDIKRAVPEVLKHGQEQPRWAPSHYASLVKGTKLADIFAAEGLLVNSFHHQAVALVAPGFVASAFAPDGIIEAVESLEHRFVLGVQWHPEGMWNHSVNYDALFDAFIAQAAVGTDA